VQIGKYCHLGQRLTIYAFNHRYEYADSIPYDALQVEKPVIIRDFVWIGANVTIVPGVIIGEGAVIGAGSVVTKNVPKHAIMGGNPASVLKFRNSEEYYLLKERKAFF
jgi:acetyltransferase-like isoleucine patch superfamily enzyme